MILTSIVFILLICLYFYLGLRYYIYKKLQPFIIWTVLLPFIPSLTILHTRFQVTVYYAFIIFPLLFFMLNTLKSLNINKRIFNAVLILTIFITSYIFYGLITNPHLTLIDILKDVKPVFFIGIGFIFLIIFRNKSIDWNGKFIRKLIKLNFFFSLFFFIVLDNTKLVNLLTNDPFYKLPGTRYLTMGTFFVIFYFIAKIAAKKKFRFWELIYIFTPVFLSGNRTFFIAIVAILITNIILSITNVWAFFRKIFLFLLGTVILFIGVLNFNTMLKERILSMFNIELAIKQLIEYRLAPFLTKLESFEWYHYILGKGPGETFFIPWFVWRENVNNYNIFMDNIYLTLYVKYGFFMFILLFIWIYFIIRTPTNRKFKLLSIVYFLTMGLTTAFMYQINFLFLIVILAGLSLKDKNAASPSPLIVS